MSDERRGDDEPSTERIEVSVEMTALPMDEWLLIAYWDEMSVNGMVQGGPVDPLDYVAEFVIVGNGRTEAQIRHRTDGTVVGRAVRVTSGAGGWFGRGRGGDPSGDREPRVPISPQGAGAVNLEEADGDRRDQSAG
jgi:hypothetical protein